MERALQKLSWMRVRELVPETCDTVILPVGTVEAHGSSCIGTDNYIPTAIAEDIAERLNALVAPTLNYGITRSLLRYAGGSTIRPETYAAFVRDILDSMVTTGFKNIIVMNGHGGNNAALKDAAFAFHKDTNANIVVIHWWELCGDMTEEFFGHTGGHAGTDETAMVLAVDPALGGEDDYAEDLAYYYRPGADVFPIPGSILLYKEGEGYPEFDVEKARAFRKEVAEQVGAFAEMVVARWRRFNL